jgi:TPR repeat protein
MDDWKKRVEDLMQAAGDGDIGAQVTLGTMLASGEGGFQNPEEAVTWLLRAARMGDTTAMYNLGVVYEKGLGTARDPDEAALWFWQAAEHGDGGARVKLGTMLLKGLGFSRQSPAIGAIEASADQGSPFAQFFYGRLLLDGTGVDQDDAAAERWFRLAADQGDESAISHLGEMMFEGRTCETSEEEMVKRFFELGRSRLLEGDLVKAFDCLVSIKRVDPGHLMARRLEEEIERANQDRLRRD